LKTMSDNTPNWFTVRLVLEPDQVEQAEDALFDAGAGAVTLLDAADHPVHEPGPGERLLWPHVLVEALFAEPPDPAMLAAELSLAGLLSDPAALQFGTLADQDWERAWMDQYQPLRFGESLWICPSHVEPDPDWPRVIRLDPGLAFGSGTHPTTAMCLEWLDANDVSGKQVLDYGCGSGILAMAAALLGAENVVGVDHDPQALQATIENAERNDLADRITVLAPEDFDPVPVDCVLANILAGPLIELAERLSDCVAPGGWLVLSGILDEQADAVIEAYASRLETIDRTSRDGWVRLVFSRT